jgi:hypothetical protein
MRCSSFILEQEWKATGTRYLGTIVVRKHMNSRLLIFGEDGGHKMWSEERKRIARLYSVFGCEVEPEVKVMSSARTTHVSGSNQRPFLRHRVYHFLFFTYLVK